MSVPGSLRTGADSPVIAASLTKPTPSMTSPSPAIVSPASTTMTSPLRSSDEPTSSSDAVRAAAVGGRLRSRLAEGGRLGPPARLGDGLGVRREQDREPQPDGDLDLEAEAAGPVDGWRPGRIGDRDDRDEDRRDLDDEHHRVLDRAGAGRACGTHCGSAARSSSGSRTPRGRGGSRRTASRRRGSRTAGTAACRGRGRRTEGTMRPWDQKAFPAFWRSCSTIGPSESAGKNVSAPTMITTPMSRTRPQHAGRRERAE